MMKFNELPQEVQEQAKTRLRCYNRVFITYEYGRYCVSTGIGVYKSYAPDHKSIGTYTADEVFTPEERIINYVENFRDYPSQYKGKRDYRFLNSLDTLKNGFKVKFNEEGDLVLA